ncbi:VOC family protein [Winogradskyella bathintestinalis]|uniref:VOC family protein n=1 Tax=Winogradskyella bathintestinalis TaxID=3035208 RepID=A0ABT7ZYY1_9FLAO|nr:VOC family protein [Winogradskyella bathintestinalis]MDN3493958.1 VOC family protein [Winogradskyella bathintestinalis]
MTKLTPFHLAIPVHNLSECRKFYSNVLNLEEGRSSDHWVDYNFFGHQLVIHYKEKTAEGSHTNSVDGKNVPVPHFGVVLEWNVFQNFARLLKSQGIVFIIEPYIRFEGEVGEQATMFFEDPSGNALEFKAFKDMSQLFAK